MDHVFGRHRVSICIAGSLALGQLVASAFEDELEDPQNGVLDEVGPINE